MNAEMVMPAGEAERLKRIAEVHVKWIDAAGGTFGECSECGMSWPCPTWQWASAPAGSLDICCTWDLADCQFEGHEELHASVAQP